VNFSKVVKENLALQEKSIVWLSEKMGCSYQYLWKLVNEKENKRWNEDSIQKACEILGIEIQFKNRSA